MRVHIRRTRLNSLPGPDGTISVAYDVYVPIGECPEDGMNRTTIVTGAAGTPWKDLDRYHEFAQATWRTDAEPGYERYEQWLEHEKRARQRMLAMLHEHCPETRGLTEFPGVCAQVAPDTRVEPVEFEIDDPLFDPDGTPDRVNRPDPRANR